jgi:hypothetical protein
MRSQVLGIYLNVGLLAVLGCGSAKSGGSTLPELPEPVTSATLVGPLCEGTSCRCAEAPGQAGAAPSKAYKRYEIRVGPSQHELWVTIDKMVLYKSSERASECFYVDLRSGKHAVGLRAHNDAGFGARLALSELTPDGKAGYQTFEFRCGGPGVCQKSALDDYRKSLAKFTRNIHDPCGSTKIRGLKWDLGRMPDRRIPSDIYVELVLEVYNFEPSHPPGHAECASNF